MELSLTTDYTTDRGCPEPYLRRIAEAGFTHVHWCHQWCTDFLYSEPEIDQIERWLSEFGLRLLDLHASAGNEKNWGSVREYERLAGVELVENRMRMTARLGADVIVLHIPSAEEGDDGWLDRLCRSLDVLERVGRGTGVRIALENMAYDDFARIGALFDRYDPAFLGLCYDSGHGCLGGEGLDHLENFKDRLLAVHLHDNDARTDQHRIPFRGRVDWERLAGLLATSSYGKCVSLESNRGCETGIDEETFLRDAHEAAARITEMIRAAAAGRNA